MTRRDTILVAVLMNAGLLIILFASALKSPKPTEAIAMPTPKLQEMQEFVVTKESSFLTQKEKELASKPLPASTSLNAAQELDLSDASQVSTPVQTPSHFVDDLNHFKDDLKMVAQRETLATNVNAQTLLAPVPKAEVAGPEFIEIKVKKGDVLEKIAKQHQTTVAEIMKANQLTGTNLKIGQVLKIPNKTIKKAETQKIAHSLGASNQVQYYIVKKGDSPWTIAAKNQMKVEDLLKLNSLTEEQARRLKPGDRLRIQ